MQKQADRELQIAGGTSALTRNYAVSGLMPSALLYTCGSDMNMVVVLVNGPSFPSPVSCNYVKHDCTGHTQAESSAAVARRNEELRKMVLSRKQMQHMTLSPQIGTGSPQLSSASSRSTSSSSSSGSSSAVVKKSLERSKDEARSNSVSNHLNTRKMHGNSESKKELKHYLAKECESNPA